MRLLAAMILSLALAVPSACSGEENSPQEYGYGPDARQRLDFWRGESDSTPLVLYIHGGGWSRGDKAQTANAKAVHFLRQGYAFASMNYRLVPDATVEQQAADVANAIAWLREKAAKLGIDQRRIVLMGHSAGAHLAALVATDPSYLGQAGVPMEEIAGVVLLDGAAYHVPSNVDDGPRLVGHMRRSAFGEDEARQVRLSPVAHAQTPNAKDFLILYVDRTGAPGQSMALAELLRRAGTGAEARLVEGSSHMRLNRNLGAEGDHATQMVDDFVKRAVTTAMTAQ